MKSSRLKPLLRRAVRRRRQDCRGRLSRLTSLLRKAARRPGRPV